MAHRIAVLEDALLTQCGESHPLLSQALQRVRIENSAPPEQGQADVDDDTVEDVGATLVIDGESHRYIGPGNTEVRRCFAVGNGEL